MYLSTFLTNSRPLRLSWQIVKSAQPQKITPAGKVLQWRQRARPLHPVNLILLKARVNHGGFSQPDDALTVHFFKKTLRSFSSEVPSLLNNYNTNVRVKSLSVMNKKPFHHKGSMIKVADRQKGVCDLRMRTEQSQNIFSAKSPSHKVSTFDHVFRPMAPMSVFFKKGIVNHSTANLLRPNVIKRRGLGDLGKKSPSQFMLPVEPDLLWDVSKVKNLGSFELGRTNGAPKRKEKSVPWGASPGRGYLNQDLQIRNYDGQKKAMRN